NAGGARSAPPSRSSQRPVLPDAVDLDAVAAGRGRQRLRRARGRRRRRRVEAVGAAEDRAALVVRLVRAVPRAERRAGDATEERALAGAVAALHHRAARGAEAGAEQRADGARLRDAHGALAAGAAVRRRRRCDAGDRGGSLRAGVGGDTVATYWVAGRTVGAGVACACASVVGRSIHAVVRPVLRAVTPVRAMPIVASFQWFLSMAMSSVSG